MGFGGVSSSVVIVLAAVLWLVYLIPTWLRRREYLATERNAVRLQQTLRIMAETAEIPKQVRAEATTRSVAAQEKVVEREMQRTQAIARAQDAAAARAAARQLAESRPTIAASVSPSSLASRRLRRARGLASLTLLASICAVGFGVALVASGGAAVLLIAGVVVAAGAVTLLVQINQVSGARAQLAQTLRPAQSAEVFDAHPSHAEPAPVSATWTPVPVPVPLYLSRREVLPTAPAQETAVEQLRTAAAEAERALRLSQAGEVPVARVAPASEPVAELRPVAESRFARMGIIDVNDSAAPDLDEVLRRRRAV